jgi:hypothetical protein
MKKSLPLLLASAVFAVATTASAEPPSVRTRVEVGFLDPLHHTIQFGNDGTEIDYVDEGGQDVLFPFFRPSVEALFGRHRVGFIYQPLNLEGEVVTRRDWVIDGLTFPADTPVNTRYSFPFYRASYGYDVLSDPDKELELGASLQLRNATITFTSEDGQLRRTERDVGPVPVLRARLRLPVTASSWFETEVDGFYAPIRYINGGASDVVGAIVDFNVRYGFDLNDDFDAFLNLRYLGGGAEGTSDGEFGDGFTRNWLHFATVSLGFTYDIVGP